jgi:proline racemase
MDLRTTDYHTAGEPFRIVVSDIGEIAGANVRERRETASATEAIDRMRRLLCHEPRGHADVYGCFVVPPDDDGADFGVLFWHKDGYSTACGHGTIALGAWAVESGRVQAPSDGEVDVVIDVPSGRVTARVRCAGGAFYAYVPAEAFGLSVTPTDLPALIVAGRTVKAALDGTPVSQHPHDDRLSGIYGTVLTERVGPRHHRNVAIFADGEVDRSPTGSATSARTALLLADGEIGLGDTWRNDSIAGTGFTARAVGTVQDGVLTEVSGTAFRTGEHRFVLDPRDDLGTGFVLR